MCVWAGLPSRRTPQSPGLTIMLDGVLQTMGYFYLPFNALNSIYAKHRKKQEKLKCLKRRAKQFCVLALANSEIEVNYTFLFAIFT